MRLSEHVSTFINKWDVDFFEAVYQERVEIELTHQRTPFQSQWEFVLKYRDRELKQRFRADLVCYEKIILELKAVSNLTDGRPKRESLK